MTGRNLLYWACAVCAAPCLPFLLLMLGGVILWVALFLVGWAAFVTVWFGLQLFVAVYAKLQDGTNLGVPEDYGEARPGG